MYALLSVSAWSPLDTGNDYRHHIIGRLERCRAFTQRQTTPPVRQPDRIRRTPLLALTTVSAPVPVLLVSLRRHVCECRYGPWAMRAAAAARMRHPAVTIRLIGVDPSKDKVARIRAFDCVCACLCAGWKQDASGCFVARVAMCQLRG